MNYEAGPRSYKGGDYEDGQRREPGARGHGEWEPVELDGQEVAARDVRECRQLARGRNYRVGQEWGDQNGDHGQGSAFQGIQAEHLHGRDAAVPEQGYVVFAALHEVCDHHGQVVDDRHDHHGQQDGQRHHGKEAPLLVVGNEASYASEQRRTRNRLYNSGIHAFDAVQQVCGAPVLEPLLVQEEEPIGRDQGIRKRQSCPIYHRLFGYKEGQGRFFRVEVHAVEHHRRQGYWVEEEVSGTVPELFIDVNRIDNAYYLDIEPTRVPDRRAITTVSPPRGRI